MDEEEEDDLEGDIDNEMDRLSDNFDDRDRDEDEFGDDADSLEDSRDEMSFSHKDADDDAFMDAYGDDKDSESDENIFTDNEVDMSALTSDDNADDIEDEEVENSNLDEYAMRNENVSFVNTSWTWIACHPSVPAFSQTNYPQHCRVHV